MLNLLRLQIILIFTTLFIFVIDNSVSQTFSKIALDTSLVAYYPFNGNANDESGYGNHGVLSGGSYVPGRIDSCLELTPDEHGDAPNATSLNPSEISVAVWVNFDALATGNSNQFLLCKGNDQTQGSYYISQNGSQQFHFYLGANGIDQVYAASQTLSLETNRWYYIAGTYDGDTLKIYVDGILSGLAPAQIAIGNTSLLHIGYQDLPSSEYFLNGRLDEVRIYNRALTGIEIDSLYYVGGWSDLVAYYPFNGNANDESGNGNHGTIYGAILIEDRFGHQDSSYSFNGSSYINCGDPMNNTLDLGTNATINAWVKTNSGGGGIIVGKDESGGSYNKYFFQILGNGQLVFHINQPSAGNGAWMYSSNWDLLTERWYNVCVVMEGLNYSFYVNGNFFGSAISWLDVPDVNAPFLIGSAEAYGYSGIIDDIRIYNRALTVTEIDSLYHIGGWPLTTFQLTVNINDGWNMVSVPGINTNGNEVGIWWPYRDMTANVFQYLNGYQSVSTTTPGIGYWMKHSGARTYNTGDEWPLGGIQIAAHDSLNALSGWNLIGGYESSVSTGNINTNPAGLRQGAVYKYSGGYQVANTLDPGYGYWIKLSGAGQIIIPEIYPKQSEGNKFISEDCGRITLTDATGIKYTLYAVKGQVDLSLYELPPAPPTGMFDVRFSSGRIAEDINSSVKTIEMSGVTYPLTVRVEGMEMRLMDETGKTVNVNLKSGEDIVISDARIQKLMVSGELIPAEYALEQNYPNPFNPSTVIEFSLPENVGNVKLSVYNMLGEKIEELVNSSLLAGKYQYEWNSNGVAAGIYFYELRTDKFVSVKKMVLLK